MSRLTELRSQVESGFLGFWVRKYRISYLIVLLVMAMGLLAAFAIPKESSPSINLGIISVVTVYPGTNPEDIDSLITDKIYKQIKDIKWVDKITTRSSLGISSVTVNVKTSAKVKDVLDDVRNKVGTVILPADAKTPVITEIKTDTGRAFSVFVYDPSGKSSRSILVARAIDLQNIVKLVSGIESVDLSASANTSAVSVGGGNETTYDAEIIIPQDKLASLGLTLAGIAGTIRSANLDQPIGNYSLGDKKYDYRIEGKNRKSADFLSTAIALPGGSQIRLGDIARIERKYKSTTENRVIIGSGGTSAPYIGLTINKSDSANIFTASDAAKKEIERIFATSEFSWLQYLYTSDLADNIRDDYGELTREAITTLVLVFIAMYLFVGFRDSLFASLTLPLAFLATFILLYYFGFTLNFLTNFSLILSFGIAVDTIIVIVQAASAKARIGYEPRTAIMLALREYSVPIISWVSVTIVVFIPMMFLPGILGKFLAYIPITIFGVLASGLLLALTVNSALYLIFARRSNTYVESDTTLEYATADERELLELERVGKTKLASSDASLRTRIIHDCIEWYKRTLRNFLEHTWLRRSAIALPFVFFVFGIIILAPRVGFELFPGDDNNLTTFVIEGPVGIRTEVMSSLVGDIAPYFRGYDEIRYISSSVAGNQMNISIELIKKELRKKLGQKSVFDLEKIWLPNLQKLESKWLKVTSKVIAGGPPSSKAVGLKIISDDAIKLPILIKVAKEFREYLKTIPGTKNITVSSQDTPGQFVFSLRNDLLALYAIPSSVIYQAISTNMNGVTVGSIEDNGEDMSVILKTDTFQKESRMEDILSIPFTVGSTTYTVGNFVDTRTQNAIASVNREAGKVQIAVEADLEKWVDSVSSQSAFVAYANKYQFPVGISYKAGGENDANSELIVAVVSAFFIAVMVIFAILTLQFNSFSQPAIILYSVVMSLPFVMVGLLLTGNQFSMPFGIGFIAFTGIAVNHGIILIDAINQNLMKGMNGFTALVEAGSSRLEPMTLTTITTALGILPIALRDRFWAGMGFTIIFGIIAASALTLFVVKGIYYEIYVAEHEWLMNKIRRKWRERKGRRIKREQ
jgi:multidrug efflux pump subunit AcrB